jgi:hypothetical protein
MMNFKHEDLPYRTLTATDKKCMIPGILECTPDGRLTFGQVVELHESAATAERSWRINEHKSNHHFDECCKEHNKYPNCNYQKAGYHEDKAERYAYMAELRHKQYDTFMQLLRN